MKSRSALTLIELLVVIAIIGILSALLLSAVGPAKESGRRIACVSNLRQVNLAIRLYAEEFADFIGTGQGPATSPNGAFSVSQRGMRDYHYELILTPSC